VDWIIGGFMLVSAALITLWMAGAIYFDVCGQARWRRWLAAAWTGGIVLMFAAWQPLWHPFAVLIVAFGLFLIWWLRQKPSHFRDWDPSVAVLPRAVREENVITIENIRNFEYRSLQDFTPRYETRTYRLEHLRGVDVIFFTWGVGLMSHPVLVFDFGSNGRVCMSIEVRFRKEQGFAVIRSLFRQQELIFLVADERDIILRRTKYSQDQEAYLYRATVEAGELRAVFLDYVEAINRLYEKPRWYNALCTNCTTSFYQLPSVPWRCDWRVIANGRLDRALYKTGRLDRTLPFSELRRTSYLNDVANAAPEEEFGDHIRRELERRRLEAGQKLPGHSHVQKHSPQ
jgi:hypothetical protein